MDKVITYLESEHKNTLETISTFQDVLTKLRYEGRANFDKNVKEIQQTIQFFNSELSPHISLEENIIFPFLQKHIPKLEPIIHMLQSEHADFHENLENFHLLMKNLLNADRDEEQLQVVEKIRQVGTYLVYLLSNHIRTEDRSIYNVMARELKAIEKRELAEKLLSKIAI